MNHQKLNQTDVTRAVARTDNRAMIAVITAVILGDWLLWEHPVGISYALFLMVLFGVHLAWHRTAVGGRNLLRASGLLAVGLVPLVEVMNPLTTCIATTAAFVACMLLRDELSNDLCVFYDRIISSAALSIFRLPIATFKRSIETKETGGVKNLAAWIAPLLLAGFFVLLFQEANPVLQRWLISIDFQVLLDAVFNPRVWFWILLACFAWPFIEKRYPTPRLFPSYCVCLIGHHRRNLKASVRPNQVSTLVSTSAAFCCLMSFLLFRPCLTLRIFGVARPFLQE